MEEISVDNENVQDYEFYDNVELVVNNPAQPGEEVVTQVIKLREKTEFDDELQGNNAIGLFVPDEGTGKLRRRVAGLPSSSSTDHAINRARKIFYFVGEHKKIGLSDQMISGALIYYKMLLNVGRTQARPTLHICAACLYIVCRLNRTTHLLIDFSEAIQADVFVLGRMFSFITRELRIYLPLIDPCLLVERYGFKLNLGESTRDISHTAVRLIGRMKRDWIHLGRRPSGICGAALLVASKLHGKTISINEIVRAVKICKGVVLKRLMDLKNTPTSELTLKDIFSKKLEDLIDQDPPSYKASHRNFLRRNELETKNKWFSSSIIDQVVETQEEIEVILGVRNVIKLGMDQLGNNVSRKKKPIDNNNSCENLSAKKSTNSDESSLKLMNFNLNIDQTRDYSKVDEIEIDDEEIDELILNEEEVKIKTIMWYRENEEYLKQKEEKEKCSVVIESMKKRRKKKSEISAHSIRKTKDLPQRIFDNLIKTAKNSIEELELKSNVNSYQSSVLNLDNPANDFEQESTQCIDLMIYDKSKKSNTSKKNNKIIKNTSPSKSRNTRLSKSKSRNLVSPALSISSQYSDISKTLVSDKNQTKCEQINSQCEQNNLQSEQNNSQYDQNNSQYDQNDSQYDQNITQFDQNISKYNIHNFTLYSQDIMPFDPNISQQYDQDFTQYNQDISQQYDQNITQYDQNISQGYQINTQDDLSISFGNNLFDSNQNIYSQNFHSEQNQLPESNNHFLTIENNRDEQSECYSGDLFSKFVFN